MNASEDQGTIFQTDEDLLPLTRQLQGVGPELHALLGLVEDLHDMVAKLPGMGRVRRRKDPAGG